MLIADFKLGQSLGKLRGIVLGVCPRSRNGPNIDDNFDVLRPQQVHELTDGAGRVPNCKNRCVMFQTCRWIIVLLRNFHKSPR